VHYKEDFIGGSISRMLKHCILSANNTRDIMRRDATC
jgi:hypothetical protein